jgi:predicted GH43/DUF377 family glycosyl hydrolase
MIALERYKGNPILIPNPEHPWESKAVFNPGILQSNGKIYIIYRAMSQDNTSVLGCAISSNGFTIDERMENPIYVPRKDFEKKTSGKVNTGCEDPRITVIGDKIYMCYTAVSQEGQIRVALTSIGIKDFLDRKFEKWEEPILISPPGVADKNACIVEDKNKYIFFHRMEISPYGIWIDFRENLDFKKNGWIRGFRYIWPRADKWDSERIGIAGVPLKVKEGWVLIYHGRSRFDGCYRLGAILLDRDNPVHVLSRLRHPILEPFESFEWRDHAPKAVFSCGHAVIDDTLFVYYGAADKCVGVATCSLSELISELLKESSA